MKPSLRKEAACLVEVLWTVVHALDDYRLDNRMDFTKGLAARLRPLVTSLEHAVLKDRSRERAKDLMADISTIMDRVNAAATKGEMAIFKDDTLTRYWKVAAIFQESRFSGEEI